MKSNYNSSNLVYWMTRLFIPSELNANFINESMSLTKVQDDWKNFYMKENHHLWREDILKILSKNYPSVNCTYFEGYQENLYTFKAKLIEELNNYRYNLFNIRHFLNESRVFRCLEESNDTTFTGIIANSLTFGDYRYTKDEFFLILETFYEVSCYIVENINKPVVNKEQLEKLGLPLDAEKLRTLLFSTEDLSELFYWKDSDKGYLFWAKLFLEKKKDFRNEVYSYMNSLHPELKIKMEKEKKEGYTFKIKL